jgi:hypothetical protein
MTEPTSEARRSFTPEERADAQQAVIALNALAGTYGSKDPSAGSRIRTADAGSDLRTLAAADPELVPASVRLGVLYRLAAAGYPEQERWQGDYEALAASVAHGRGDLSPRELLDDLRSGATGPGLSASTTLRSSAHHEVAFLGQDVCNVRRVLVDGRDAVWIYSEFETDTPFENVAEWVDPRNWPQRSPLLFNQMAIVGANLPVDIADGGAGRAPDRLEHWHSVFLEEVQLVTQVNTLLHCDFRRDGTQSAGMTYELAFSPDNEINVDRGFLLVNELGSSRLVKALKIVGFVDRGWNDVAERVCPIWTDFVQQAVRGGHNSGARPPSHLPPGGGPAPSPFTENLEPWLQFFGRSALTYLQLFDDVTTRMSAPGYGTSDFVQDGRRYWSQLAQDWAKAWTTGLDALEGIAEQGLDSGVPAPGASTPRRPRTGGTGAGAAPGPTAAAPGARMAAAATGAPGEGATTTPAGPAGPREEPEATDIPVGDLTEGEPVSVTDLVSIEAGGTTIPATEVTVTRTVLPGGVTGVRVQTRNRSASPGLYVGELRGAAGRRISGVQLYLSRAREA